ncbi:MAG: hypothetical protein AAGA56_11870 [Myxococcota bacterium]
MPSRKPARNPTLLGLAPPARPVALAPPAPSPSHGWRPASPSWTPPARDGQSEPPSWSLGAAPPARSRSRGRGAHAMAVFTIFAVLLSTLGAARDRCDAHLTALAPVVAVGAAKSRLGTSLADRPGSAATPPGAREPSAMVVPRADQDLDTTRPAERSSPGMLFVPHHLRAPDGRFDLLIHFHGFPDLVQDSVLAARLNAVVFSVNLGIGGAPYRARMARPDAFDRIVERVRARMESKGLAGASVRRVAVSGWSAGYGAVFQLLQDPQRDTAVDALLLLDTPHGSFIGDSREIQPESVTPYVAYARRAMRGERLFIVTHSAITTARFASTTETTDFVLDRLALRRTGGGAPVGVPTIDTAHSAFPALRKAWLEPTSHCREGDFHLLGFAGRTPENHIAHLAQMSETALPLLRARWGVELETDPKKKQKVTGQ